MALFLSVELGDELKIGNSTIAFEEKSGRRVKLKIDSSEDIEHIKPSEEKEKPAPVLTRPKQVA